MMTIKIQGSWAFCEHCVKPVLIVSNILRFTEVIDYMSCIVLLCPSAMPSSEKRLPNSSYYSKGSLMFSCLAWASWCIEHH